ncbi:unnamed protein product [Cyclocybe aegerita]|uniref:Uncharacterized protein n=1 Tax=Cyclocybe aegerita TaxID=1973307 RepID=A0A8S0XGX7_CYCAE|nr:unnamed protein product [Cyclocybe aegerita]
MFIVGETYRFQNVEYGTLLEMGEGRENAPFTLRVAKEASENQQWSLIDAPKPGGYHLRNVGWSGAGDGTAGNRVMAYQVLGGGHQVWVTYDANRALQWTVDRDATKDEYIIRFNLSVGTWFFLGARSSEAPVCFHDITSTAQTAPSHLRWKFTAVWPSIPRDVYFIRSFGGLGLYMAVAGQPLQEPSKAPPLYEDEENLIFTMSANRNNTEHQPWDVEPLSNGRVRLRNVQMDSFLETQRNEVTYGDLVGKLNASAGAAWQLRSIGGFGFSISISSPEVTNVPLALTVVPRNGRNQVFLSPLTLEISFGPLTLSSFLFDTSLE